MATPLTNLTKKEVKWEWTDKCQEAFEQIKECLTTAPLLKMPDPNRPFEVVVDASKIRRRWLPFMLFKFGGVTWKGHSLIWSQTTVP